jgi:phage baseplate assembly protein W
MFDPAAPPVGWPLLPVPDAAGRMTYPTLEESVRQSIRVILSTRPGEQLMRPEFGGGLADFLHEPDTLVTRRRIRDAVAEGLAKWERRAEVVAVEVADGDRPGAVRVVIAYRLRRTGAAQRLGLTVSLEG